MTDTSPTLTEAEQTALARIRAGTHVMVPKEPTRAMMEASLGWREFDCPEEYLPVDDSVGWLSVAYGHYRCMIWAAQEGK
jgi:hypothetical protein